MGIFSKIKDALHKTSEKISVAVAGKKVDENFSQDIEDALIMADTGVKTAEELTSKIINRKFSRETSDIDIKQFLADEIASLLKPYESDFFEQAPTHNPEIVLVIGVNGNGKTTCVAKMANLFKQYNPLLVAADTFRAAAVEQLKFWADKVGVDICTAPNGSDAAGLVYSAIEQARANKNGIVLIDTAGRMQNRDDLLAELEKIKRVIKKHDESAPHKTILVLDGLTGQAAHSQVDVFLKRIGLDGVIITKLDGTAKGGALVSLTREYNIPVFAIGIGEGIDDLKPFRAEDFSKALIGVE